MMGDLEGEREWPRCGLGSMEGVRGQGDVDDCLAGDLERDGERILRPVREGSADGERDGPFVEAGEAERDVVAVSIAPEISVSTVTTRQT